MEFNKYRKFLIPAIAVALIVNANLNSNNSVDNGMGKWPTSWGKFKKANKKLEDKAYRSSVTVFLTKSLPYACQRYQALLILDDNYTEELVKRAVSNHMAKKYSKISNSEEERYGKNYDSLEKLANTTIRQLLAAEVEVLRQIGEDDWKLYSRWSPVGVGDKHALLSEKERTNLNLPYRQVPKALVNASCRPFL